MRTGINDKELISRECFRSYQQIEALQALVSFALLQADNAEPEDFSKLQPQWKTMLRLMKEKLDIVEESNGEAAYIADTYVPGEETTH